MHLIRRAVFRAATSPISKPRSINTSSPFLLRPKVSVQNGISSSVFRRFASDEANSLEEKSQVDSADAEHGSVQAAVDSVAETASTYAGDEVEGLVNGAEKVGDAVIDGAAAAAASATPFGSTRDNGTNDQSAFERNSERGNGFRSTHPARDLVPSPSIYIGNLLFDISPDDLSREFQEYGTVKSTQVATDARGLSKGFGYVEFSSIAEATAAIEAKHQTLLEGRRIIVNYMAKTLRQPSINPPSKTLFIGNLAFEMTDADLNKLFRDIRNVIDVRVAIDRRTGQPRGFAHADFVDIESAVKGHEILQGKDVYGRQLRVDYSPGRH